MLTAAFGLGAADALERLRRLGAACGATAQEELSTASGALIVWRGPGRLSFDRARHAAWSGRRDGPLDGAFADWAPRQRGDFALVRLTDDGLMLGRGPFGGRSLFYARELEGRRLVVCSRFGPLLATLEGDTSIDVDRIAAYVAWRSLQDVTRTPVRGIARAGAAEILRFRTPASAPERVSTWSAPVEPELANAEEAALGLRRELEAAVARAVSGSRRVGVLVGGGLDSSAVTAAAVALSRGASPREVHAIAMHFAGPSDDRPYMRALADDLGIEPIHLPPHAAGPTAIGDLVVDGLPLPAPTTPWELHAARVAASRGVDTLLTGMGGDDLFDGDFNLFDPTVSPSGPLRAVADAFRLRGVPWAHSTRERLELFVVRPVLRKAMPRAWRLLRRARGRVKGVLYAWAGPVLERTMRDAVSTGDPDGETTAERIAALARAHVFVEIRDAHVQSEIVSGCTSIDPLLDDDLGRFTARIPPRMFFYGNLPRGLFRHAIRGLVPESVRLREGKAGFEPAISDILRSLGGAEALESLLEMRGLADLGIVEPRGYRSRFRVLFDDPMQPAPWVELWPALSAEAFVQRYRSGGLFAAGGTS